jgi:hypothetical protein
MMDLSERVHVHSNYTFGYIYMEGEGHYLCWPSQGSLYTAQHILKQMKKTNRFKINEKSGASQPVSSIYPL